LGDPAFVGKQVRLVASEGDAKIVDFNQAIQESVDAGFDLVVVSESSEIPVFKIMDFAKNSYQHKKVAKKQKKNETKVKEVKMTPNISSHDLEVKMKQIKKFLSKKMRVKVTVFLKGREIHNEDGGMEFLKGLLTDLEDVAIVDAYPKANGRNISMALIGK
jgi:translation initiation factor IF-3